MSSFIETPFHLEEKDYGAVKQNPANFAPWYGTNYKNPGQYDLLPVDLPEDRKVDVTQVETKPIVTEIHEEQQIATVKARKPRVLEGALILFGTLALLKILFGKQTPDVVV